jgi:uncharacterized phage protein (TIGR02216 family)
MQLAFGQLGLSPRHFWRMSAIEFQAALDGCLNSVTGTDGLTVLRRAEMDALCAQFPDTGAKHAPYE